MIAQTVMRVGSILLLGGPLNVLFVIEHAREGCTVDVPAERRVVTPTKPTRAVTRETPVLRERTAVTRVSD